MATANLNDFSTKELLIGFNALTGSTVKKFESRKKAVVRVAKALETAGKSEDDLQALIEASIDEAGSDVNGVVEDEAPAIEDFVEAAAPATMTEAEAEAIVAAERPEPVEIIGTETLTEVPVEDVTTVEIAPHTPLAEPAVANSEKEGSAVKMPRAGSKKAAILDAALRPEGVTDYELKVLTGWPSAKGTLYRVVKAAGMTYETIKREDTKETAWKAVSA